MPPYSDNLYSGDMSDEEEVFNDELSPSDGYFGRPEMPTNRLVPDPTIDYGPPEAKTLIDPPDSQPNSDSSSRLPRHHPTISQLSSSPPYVAPGAMSHATPVTSHRRVGSFSEQDPLISHAPPAYSESPPQSSSTTRSSNVYSTFPEQQLERGFFTQHEPESMGGPVGGLQIESTPLVGCVFSPRRRNIKALICAGLVLALVSSTVAVIFGFTKMMFTVKPVKSVAEYCPAAVLKHDQTVYGFSAGKELNIIHKIKEEHNAKSYPTVAAEGEIRLRKAPVNSTHGNQPYITVDMGTSTRMTTTLNWSEDSQTLQITTPRYTEDRYTSKTPCLYVIVTAWFPDGTEIPSILFDSPTLNLALSDVKVNVTSTARFNTGSGSIWFSSGEEEHKTPFSSARSALCAKPGGVVIPCPTITTTEMLFSSRRTTIETVSGDISGIYPILDDLIISSESGDITVFVAPQVASKISPAPADLEVQTASGDIYIEYPLHHIRVETPHEGERPAHKTPLQQPIPVESVVFRDYITRVHSTSGKIAGFYYLGSESSFKTTSGDLDFNGTPVLPTDEGTSMLSLNNFETHTVSGKSSIVVQEPIFFPTIPSESATNGSPLIGDSDPYRTITPPSHTEAIIVAPPKLRSLRSAHSSNTGKIVARYPDAWQGSVHVKTVNGDIKVRGESFRTVKDKKGWAFREVEKMRGVNSKREASMVDISNISGDVSFKIQG